MSNHCDLLKNTFSKVIYDYETARPKYPQELYQAICEFSNIQEGAEILEVGAGTGQATELFLNKGYRLELLEVSEEQVLYLRSKYENQEKLTVQKDYFEEFQTTKKYDLIFSATAFHWVQSDIGYPKAWELLKEGGTLAVFWQMSSVTYYNSGLFIGLNALKQKYLPNESLGFDKAGIEQVKERRIRQIQSGGYFGEPKICIYNWTDMYDADRYATLVNTYSSTQLLAEAEREAYLQEIRDYVNANGGIVELPQQVYLYLVKK